MTFSIGDVLEQLSDDFPDITVSKIRFLESQGLIAPMRTASGFRMFSDIDVTKLKWILLLQRDRFLPLKVIKEHLATITDEAFADGALPQFDFENSGTLPLEGSDQPIADEAPSRDTNDNVIDLREKSHLTSVPEHIDEPAPSPAPSRVALMQEAPSQVRTSRRTQTSRPARVVAPIDSPMNQLDIDSLVGSTEAMTPRKAKAIKTAKKSDAPLTLESMVAETGLSGPTLKDLVKFGVIQATGTGNALVFSTDEIALALAVAPLLERGIEVRHIKNYALFAAREIGFLEYVVQDDLRKRNPEAREIAQEKAKQFIQDTARLKELLLLRALRDETQS